MLMLMCMYERLSWGFIFLHLSMTACVRERVFVSTQPSGPPCVCVEADLGGQKALEKHTVTSSPLTSELYKCIKAKKTQRVV